MTSKSGNEAEESLLYSARHGETAVVEALLQAKYEKKLTLNINCKGRSKTNLGWTPLHLATYFAHKDVVEVLLGAGADVDEVNDNGDTALHKASFIGNEELVILLLNYKADVNIMNGEGRTASDVCKTHDVQRLLEAAQRAEKLNKERLLLTAAKEGQVDDVQALLSGSSPPNINCVDSQGNTCLHCAAYRGHARVAVLLLQNGIDTSLRNQRGQLAIDLAKDNDMREVLSVRPVQKLQRTAARFEGRLLKKSRFFGWKPVWAVLQRGVLIYYGSRAAAATGGNCWISKKYLDGAKLSAPNNEPSFMQLCFSDGDRHRLAIEVKEPNPLAYRQSWVTALNEHIAYSGHYLWAGAGPEAAKEATEDADDDCKPLGSMQDAITGANNQLALLKNQLRECGAIVAALENSVNVGNSLHHSAYMNKRKKKKKKQRKNFFDIYEGSESGDDDDTLVTAALSSPLGTLSSWGSSPDLTRHTPIGSGDSDQSAVSVKNGSGASASGSSRSVRSWGSARSSSRGTFVSQDGHVYRNARPHRRNRPSSSKWSL